MSVSSRLTFEKSFEMTFAVFTTSWRNFARTGPFTVFAPTDEAFNKLGKAMFHKLKVYRGAEHPHQAQKPQAITVK